MWVTGETHWWHTSRLGHWLWKRHNWLVSQSTIQTCSITFRGVGELFPVLFVYLFSQVQQGVCLHVYVWKLTTELIMSVMNGLPTLLAVAIQGRNNFTWQPYLKWTEYYIAAYLLGWWALNTSHYLLGMAREKPLLSRTYSTIYYILNQSTFYDHLRKQFATFIILVP